MNEKMKVCEQRFEPAVRAVREALFESPDNGWRVIVGIDGMCATGKSTLGMYLQSLFGGNLFHMDDFFLQPAQRTPERLAEVGGNVDYERFREEVVNPLLNGEDILYRPYDCQTQTIESARKIENSRLNIIEGSYSLHPYLEDIYTLRFFTESTPERQLANIRGRNGEQMLVRFVQEWIPKENAYFDTFSTRENCILLPWDE